MVDQYEQYSVESAVPLRRICKSTYFTANHVQGLNSNFQASDLFKSYINARVFELYQRGLDLLQGSIETRGARTAFVLALI